MSKLSLVKGWFLFSFVIIYVTNTRQKKIKKRKFPWKSKKRNQFNSYDINIEFCKHLKSIRKKWNVLDVKYRSKKTLELQLGQLGVSWGLLQLHFNLSFTVSNLDVLEKQEAFKFGKQAKQKLLTRNRNFRHNTKQGQNFKICSYYKAVSTISPYCRCTVNSVITGEIAGDCC